MWKKGVKTKQRSEILELERKTFSGSLNKTQNAVKVHLHPGMTPISHLDFASNKTKPLSEGLWKSFKSFTSILGNRCRDLLKHTNRNTVNFVILQRAWKSFGLTTFNLNSLSQSSVIVLQASWKTFKAVFSFNVSAFWSVLCQDGPTLLQ